MKIHIASNEVLERILRRKRKIRNVEQEIDLSAVLREILKRAYEFVPSESGSILLDDPLLKLYTESQGKLYFLACFGKGSSSLIGTSIPDDVGIAGETYQKGRSYISRDVRKDARYYPRIDKKTQSRTFSVICSPIIIDASIIGVIELINRKDGITYDRKDLALLDIFAGYTATLITNALDARRFEELSKRDNLTGLYNDRYLFNRLMIEIKKARERKSNISVIFFDLDRFKEVNDTKGHLAGSRVLKEVGEIMEEIFIDTNAVLSRYGGDEFVVLLPDTNQKKALVHAERLRARIDSHIFLRRKGPNGEPPLNIKGVISCSSGVASLTENTKMRKDVNKAVEALIKAADGAMYDAKFSGKNKVVPANTKRKL